VDVNSGSRILMRHESTDFSNDRFLGLNVRWALRFLTTVSLILTLLPCAYLCVWAYCGTDQRNELTSPSWQWFSILLTNSQWLSAIAISLCYAILCPAICCLLIAVFAYSIHFSKRWMEGLSGSLLLAVMLTPSVSLALAYKYVAGILAVPEHLAYAIGNTLVMLPIAYALFEASQSNISRERLQAGLVLGATHYRNFCYVFLPQVWRPLLSAYVICFFVSLDESVFSVTLFDSPRVPITKMLWDLVDHDATPKPAAAVLLLASFSGLFFFLASLGFKKIRLKLKARRKHAQLY
jgi:ABC-type spermidine/putrescine transport system permease subunit II